MIELIRSWYRRKVAEGEVALEETRNANLARKQLSSVLLEASNFVTERPDAGGWELSGRPYPYMGHIPTDQWSMLRKCRYNTRFDPNGRAALMNMVYYIIGEGVKITPQSKDERIHRLWREFWNSPRNKMAQRQAEIVLRTLRDGESFIEYFNTDESNTPTGKTTVRFRDPELCQDPGLEYAGPGSAGYQGIKCDPDDPETPIEYYFKHSYAVSDVDVLPAARIQHIKIFSDSEQKRGESYLQAALDSFTQYKEWLRYRIILNKVRTAIVLIRKIEGGTSDDVKAIASKISTSSTAKTGETRKQMPPPGTIINANAGVDYKFESANINATDAAEDGRSLKLQMAAACNEPEYVFGDASNANYASTLIAESPFVKGVRFWQTFFEQHLKEMFRRVVKAAVDAGKLQAPPEDDPFVEAGVKVMSEASNPGAPANSPKGAAANGSESNRSGKGSPEEPASQISEAEAFWGCDVQWPEVVHRDIKETTDAMVAQVNAGLVSEPTASSILGHDYDEEVRRQQVVEAEKDTNPFKTSGQDENAPDDEEMADLMSGLSPEESQQILKSNDPGQIVALLRSRKRGGPPRPGKVPGGKQQPPQALTQA